MLCFSASAVETVAIIELKVRVNASTSRLEPVVGSAVSKLRDSVISASDLDSVSMGRARLRAVHTLTRPATQKTATPSQIIGVSTLLMTGSTARSIESSV